MLKNFDFDSTHVEKEKRSELGEVFAKLQRQLKKTDSSMLVIIDGWESSGKGFVLKDLTRELDPRYFEVSIYEQPRLDDEVYTFLRQFVKHLPKKGNIAFFNRSFYYEMLNDLELVDKELAHQLMDISLLERLLVADGTLVVKLFLNHTKETMKHRIKKLEKDNLRHFLISKNDKQQLKRYDEYLKHMDNVLEKTNFSESTWHIISTEHKKNASRMALKTVIHALTTHLEKPETKPFLSEWEPDLLLTDPPLDSIDLSKKTSEEEYNVKKDALQKRAGELVYEFWLKKIPVVLVFEGTDAAGKGGAIQRLTRYMDPRGFDVATTAAPTPHENDYHYLWRFYKSFPEKGRATIYDRSWYGRVMVERIEQFTKKERWQDAYNEINEMEHNLVHEGHLLLKFLIVIDKDEQKARFQERMDDPEKNYKITDEDWRNHEKFDDYKDVMNEMLLKTSTNEAPWTIVEGNQKYYARLKVLETFIEQAEAFLEKED